MNTGAQTQFYLEETATAAHALVRRRPYCFGKGKMEIDTLPSFAWGRAWNDFEGFYQLTRPGEAFRRYTFAYACESNATTGGIARFSAPTGCSLEAR